MPVLDRSNPLPLYYQLKEILKQQIQAGHLVPHTALPSESELEAQYHVSRATVRQATTELVHEGYLYRQHGRGTFVCEPHAPCATASELMSLSDDIRHRGMQPGGRVFVSELVRGSQRVREHLRLTNEEQVVRLERLRTADDVPVAYEINYLPYPRAARVYQRAKEAAKGSLYQMMASEGLRPSLAEQVLKAGLAAAREADVLCIAQNQPGIRLESTVFNDMGAPIEYTEAFFPDNAYDFRITLRIQQS
ncbi:MAG TPA: GntR family transcriptional regulator [Ktedonobacteraceae bacterium]|nr:GntR family transcriptional regulator [Ktedonobacteraceae bacterium]